MKKVFLSLFMFASLGAMASEKSVETNNQGPCSHYATGNLSCGMAYSACASTPAELCEIIAELDFLNCKNKKMKE